MRRIIDELDPDAAAGAFEKLRTEVTGAAEELSGHASVAEAVGVALASGGVGASLADTPIGTTQVGFRADDGSAEALLRTLQPTVHLDDAGPLALTNHGSTAAAALGVAEAILLATAPGAIILADDFGDQLDTANAEHLAAQLRASAGQVWLSTRRPEVVRSFEPAELVRLTRHGGVRACHRLQQRADAGDWAAPNRLAKLLAQHGRIDEAIAVLQQRRVDRNPVAIPLHPDRPISVLEFDQSNPVAERDDSRRRAAHLLL